MKKTILTFFITVIGSITALAGINTIVVTCGDETTNIALNEKPVATVDNGNLVITTEQSTLTYETDKIIAFSFAEVSGIEDLVAPSNGNSTFFLDGNTLKIYNLTPSSMVSIYSLSGMVYYQGNANAHGNMEINLENCAGKKNVLIVKTTDKSIKISKK